MLVGEKDGCMGWKGMLIICHYIHQTHSLAWSTVWIVKVPNHNHCIQLNHKDFPILLCFVLVMIWRSDCQIHTLICENGNCSYGLPKWQPPKHAQTFKVWLDYLDMLFACEISCALTN